MGPVAAAIAVVAKIAAAATIKGFLVRTALTIAASALMRALTPKPKAGGAANATGVEQQRQIGENTPRAVALGWTIVAGSEAALWASGDGDDNKFNTRVIVVSDWPCALQKVWVDGRALTFDGDINAGWFACQQYRSKAGAARLWMRFVKGDWEQGVDGDLVSYAAANGAWGSEDRLRGVSALLIRRQYDADAFPAGAPDNNSLRVEVKDAPVYDWRDVTQSLGDVRTWKPSENAVVLCENALCLLRAPAQFSPGSTAPLVGPGMDFARRPLAKLTAMANICDELVDGVPRYRAGGVVGADMTGRDIIARFAAACGGQWVSSGDGGYLRPGHVPTPTMEIPAGALSATESDAFDPWARPDATINSLIGSYPDPSNAWEIMPLPPATDAAWVARDGGVRSATEDLSFVPYREQAWRLVVRKVRAAQLQGTRQFTGPHWLVEVEPGDIVTAPDLGLPYASGTWWMVNSTTMMPRTDGVRAALSLSQIDASIDDAPPVLGAPSVFTPRALSRALLAPALDVVQRVATTGTGAQRPQIVSTLPDASAQGLANVELRGPGISLAELPSTGQRQTADLSRGLPFAFDAQPGFYQYRSRGRDASGALGLPSAWIDLTEVTAPVVAGDSARLGGVLAADILAGLGGATSDGIFSRSEKRDFVPTILAIIGAAPELSTEAAGVGITTERTAFDGAMTSLNNLLATLTTPVMWFSTAGSTDIPNPNAFGSAVGEALRTRDELIAALGREASKRAVFDNVTGATKPENNANRTSINTTTGAITGVAAGSGTVVANNKILRGDGEIGLVDALANNALANAAAASAAASAAQNLANSAGAVALDGRNKADELISGVRTAFRAGLLGSTSEAALNTQFSNIATTLAGKTDIATTSAIGVRVGAAEAINATQQQSIVTLQGNVANKAEASTVTALTATVNNNRGLYDNFVSTQAGVNGSLTTQVTLLDASRSNIFPNLLRNPSGIYGAYSASADASESNFWNTDTNTNIGLGSDATQAQYRFRAVGAGINEGYENFYSLPLPIQNSFIVFGGAFYNDTGNYFGIEIYAYNASGASLGQVVTRETTGLNPVFGYRVPAMGWGLIERRVNVSDWPSGATTFRYLLVWNNYTGFSGFTKLQLHYGTVLPPFAENSQDTKAVNARITQVAFVQQLNTAAQASVNQNINVRFGTVEGNVSANATAIATVGNRLALYYGIKLDGNGTTSLELMNGSNTAPGGRAILRAATFEIEGALILNGLNVGDLTKIASVTNPGAVALTVGNWVQVVGISVAKGSSTTVLLADANVVIAPPLNAQFKCDMRVTRDSVVVYLAEGLCEAVFAAGAYRANPTTIMAPAFTDAPNAGTFLYSVEIKAYSTDGVAKQRSLRVQENVK